MKSRTNTIITQQNLEWKGFFILTIVGLLAGLHITSFWNGSTSNPPMGTTTTTTIITTSTSTSTSTSTTAALPATPITTAISEEVLKAFQQSKQQLIEQVKNEYYGIEYFQRMFMEDSGNDNDNGSGSGNLRTIFPRNTTSYRRLTRKIMMKLLQSKIRIASSSSTVSSSVADMIPFVWVTGGNSVAAGHGNLYNETYTAVLYRSTQQVLATMGIQFIVRNYAMSAARSAPETALCQSELYGTDMDVLFWHFGLTDGDDIARSALLWYRVGIDQQQQHDADASSHSHSQTTSRPAIIAMDTQNSAVRRSMVHTMEDMGLSIVGVNDAAILKTFEHVPDTFGMTDDEINQLLPFVRNMKCEKRIESGDPYCYTAKFNLDICPKRIYQTDWHPGWRWNAVIGYLTTFSMFRLLDDAIEQITLSNITDANELLQQLQIIELEEYQQFYHSDIPSDIKGLYDDNDDEVNHTVFVKSPTICHTGMQPAEARNHGIITNSRVDPITGIVTFEKEVGFNQALVEINHDDDNAPIRLVYTEHIRFRQPSLNLPTLEEDYAQCPIETNIDHRDYFFLHYEENWKKLIVPNEQEMKMYQSSGGGNHTLYGYIAICLVIECHNGCPPLAITRGEILDNEMVAMEVNGINVTSKLQLKDECHLLRNEDGYIWPTIQQNVAATNGDTSNTLESIGRFEISAKVLQPTRYLRIGTVIVW